MVQYKCRSCGGEMEIGSSGSLICPYCGSKSFMTDADFNENEQFRKKLLEYFKASAQNKEFDYESDTLWKCNGEESYITVSGQSLSIQYMYKYDYEKATCYLARESVVYVFDDIEAQSAFMRGLKRLIFPAADAKLHRCFPNIKMEIDLEGGKAVSVFVRRPHFYPVELFAPLQSEHLAWVISRMENICCAFEYAGITHGGICETSIWINPITHEGAIFGDWSGVKDMRVGEDLKSLRRLAINLAQNANHPIEMYSFLIEAPSKDAFADFEKWDEVINKGFGGHRFIKM